MRREERKQARAQRKWEARIEMLRRSMQPCQRCNATRAHHNRGNRFYDDSICKRFLEREDA
jgi:hypothetical protein